MVDGLFHLVYTVLELREKEVFMSFVYSVSYEMNLDEFVSAPTLQGWKARTVEFDNAGEAAEFINIRLTMPQVYRNFHLDVLEA